MVDADAVGAGPTPYRSLDDALILKTIARLRDRIGERFPGASLERVAAELHALAGEASECVAYLRRPNWPLRIAVALTIAAGLGAIVVFGLTVQLPTRVEGLVDLVGLVESVINDLVFLAIAVFFLMTTEGRLKRRRALPALHEIRSIVHIVDMHQLTKDPERLMSGQPDTPSSPARTMTAAELGRYLDYCSELLSLASKVAALFVQHFNDPVVLATVNEIESLAAGTSSKVWQKITLLQRRRATDDLV
jgi:hypothetical protein